MKEARREAGRWILQAEDDLRFVQWVQREGVFFDKGCFLAQQAGEKALKACLYALGERRVIGHSLFEMTLRLAEREARFGSLVDEARRLDRYYITTRYPNGLPGGSPFQAYRSDDLESAAADVTKIVAASLRFLGDLAE
ncbi:MAG: HEPN domain-containing protein [Deltaproteobacteria bacterium]|nr:HEPN domain-containing protein [Deltaproteobacteria bacterium]